ncbi:MAG: hypothetical protein GY754_15875 [bacterium]|nr:hypothetical protein [bacterium]
MKNYMQFINLFGQGCVTELYLTSGSVMFYSWRSGYTGNGTITTLDRRSVQILYNNPAPRFPLYRYWNGGIRDHFYTTNWGEPAH